MLQKNKNCPQISLPPSMSQSIQTQVQDLAQAYFPRLQTWRRHLHQYPELSFEEEATRDYLEAELQSLGLAPKRIGGTGLYIDLAGSAPGPHRLLRADIDALPIQETDTGKSYHSRHPGLMHACGHDAHSSALLGAVAILHDLRAHWRGTIRAIFQPGEEKLPGGASLLIEQGVLQPAGAYILGQHIEPAMPLGCIGLCAGPFMASADELYLRVIGKGGHGARPQDCVDPILISAHLLTALQQLVSRYADPLQPVVLSFGKIYSEGGATNIIPGAVRLEGTLRAFDEALRRDILTKLRHLAEGLCRSMGGDVECDIRYGYPALHNEAKLTARFREKALAYLGEDKVLDLPPRMGAEDFAFYAQAMPACFYRLGVENPNGSGLHSPSLDIREEALSIGAGLMAFALMEMD